MTATASRAEDQPTNDRWWRIAAPLLVALPFAAIAWHPLANNDLPLHLAIGEWVRAHGIPATDPFSFTAGGADWVPHEWLAGVLFSWIHDLLGASGLIGFAMLLSGAIALLTWRIARHFDQPSEQFLCWAIPVALMVGPRLILRPHLIALPIALSVTWLLLVGRRAPRWWWMTLPLLAIWGNVHGSFVLGIALVIGAMIFDRDGRAPIATRAAIGVAAAATIFAQAHVYTQESFLAGIRHVFELTSDPVFMNDIEEWRSPLTSEMFRQTWAFGISIVYSISIAVAVLAGRGRDRPLWFHLFALGSFVLYLESQRFLALYALVAVSYLPTLPLPRRPEITRATLTGFVVVASIFFLGVGLPYRYGQSPRLSGGGWLRHHLAIDQVDELTRREYEGGVLCEYHYGGVVAWHGRGKLKPTMDSRNSVYGADLYRLHRGALEAQNYVPLLEQLRASKDPGVAIELAKLDRSLSYLDELLEKVGAVLIRDAESFPDRAGLHQHLLKLPEWKPVNGTRGGAILYLKTSEDRG